MSETGLLPAYLIVGTDGVKRDHAVSRMKARLEKSGMVEFNLDERDMTKDPDIESIIGSLNTFPMGSEFRLVILDGCSKLCQVIIEHARVFARTRNELLGTSRRDGLTVLRRHLLNATRQFPALGTRAVDDSLLVDLGDCLIQARILGK